MAFVKPAVVIDNGSFNIKAGFACDNHPLTIFRCAIGRPNYLMGSYGKEPYDVHVGDEAFDKIDDLELNHPIQLGRIVHWDNMERIWHHIFYNELKVAPEDRTVMLAVSTPTTIAEKVRCCEIFFETLNSPGLCIQPQAVLSVYGSGYSSGVCVDVGYDTTDVSPVFEGGLVKYAHMQTGVSGAQISDYLSNQYSNFDFGIRKNIYFDDMLRRSVFVTKNIAVNKKEKFLSHTFPSGEKVRIIKECFMAGEMLFQPEEVQERKTGQMPLQEAVATAVNKCDSDLHAGLYNAVVPCGGLSMLPAFNDRLQVELNELTECVVNIVPSPEQCTLAWLGGAVCAGIPDATKLWVTQKQYEDYGAKIVKNKFL